ncbi:YMGG-like glycine zipper-containing protein [Croceibacterium sp. TMG7-5b_MA50]|uniref:YMGG-like glycine zipper-containing protein n=1 Tax=Croceibacterium sp. TMG7-5b_MA50 TaxID=3121290 RepID=UPI003221EB51
MRTNPLFATALALSTLSLGACAENYAAEGAGLGAVAGAAIGAVTGGDVLTGAAVGAAAGGAAGYFVDKDDRCNGYDSRGRLDDDCYGTQGYPVRPR